MHVSNTVSTPSFQENQTQNNDDIEKKTNITNKITNLGHQWSNKYFFSISSLFQYDLNDCWLLNPDIITEKWVLLG